MRHQLKANRPAMKIARISKVKTGGKTKRVNFMSRKVSSLSFLVIVLSYRSLYSTLSIEKEWDKLIESLYHAILQQGSSKIQNW